MPDFTTDQPALSNNTGFAASWRASLKWGVVLTALIAAIVWDGVATFKADQTASNPAPALATITYPADRCGPDCAIMMASDAAADQTGSIDRPARPH